MASRAPDRTPRADAPRTAETEGAAATAALSALPVSVRKAMLDAAFPRPRAAAPVSALVEALFPELAASPGTPPPAAAPALWARDRQAGETAPAFIRRVYGDWLGRGLTRRDIRRLDLRLYQALATWISRHGEPDFDLPTVRMLNARWRAAVRPGPRD